MTIRIDHLSRAHAGCARRGGARSPIALALAAAALVASATGAFAGVPQIGGAWSSGFDDWAWTGAGLVRPGTPAPLADWAEQCLVDCGPGFGTYVVRRTELMTSNAADVSVNRAADSTGHLMAVSGAIVTERLAPDSFMTNWVVTGERALDSGGTHSWSLLSPDISPDARWLPIQPYRFEEASFSMSFDAAASASATPEAPVWAMMLIGFAALGAAAYRSSRNGRRPVHFREGIPR